MTNPLPKPTRPYSGWGDFCSALWRWGLANIDEEVLDKWVHHAAGEMTKPRKDDGHLLRPSSNLNCEMKLYLLRQGFKPEKKNDFLKPTFNVGHLLHAHFFAQVESALPEGFLMKTEHLVDMSTLDWWPKDPAVAKQTGSADLLLSWEDDGVAADYFGDKVPYNRVCLVDVKSTADHMWRQKNKQPKLGFAPDSLGYESQLAVYYAALGLDGPAYFAYVNRNILSGKAPPAMVEMSENQLRDEIARIEKRVTDPQAVPEMLLTWEKQVSWVCGAYGKDTADAMCDFCVPCSEFWPQEGLDV